MKKNLIAVFVALIVMSSSIYAQAPHLIPFTGKAMNGTNPVTAPFSVIVKILEDFPTGVSKYEEVFNNVQADPNGIYQLNIGGNIAGSLINVNWGTKKTFLSVAIDLSNTGSAVGLTPSVTQFLSVPYALFARESGGGSIDGDQDWILKFGNSKHAVNSGIYQSADGIQIGFHGIPLWVQKSALQVSSTEVTNSYFSSWANSSAGRAIKAEFLSVGRDGIAVEGKSSSTDFYGIGGRFTGGWKAIEATVNATGSNMYYGVLAEVIGGATGKTGMGVRAISSGSGTNYGVYGYAYGGTTNYAGYFSGNVTVTGTFSNVSDMKFKSDIQPISNSLSTLMKLEPKTYSFKTKEFKSMNLPEGKHYGFVAQELEKIMPELVTNNIQPAEYNEKKEKTSDEIKFKAVNYIEMISLLVASVQEQEKIIEKMQMEIEKLKQTNPIKK